MIILIGGESHTGKTILAQKLMEIYKIPYTSIDHIKMGMYRGYRDCGYTPTDSDDTISKKIWPVINGIIQTCIENCQDIILEGCYLPHEQVKEIMIDDIIPLYLCFSESYIINNYINIINFENIIEKRMSSGDFDLDAYIKSNNDIRIKCENYSLPCFDIDQNYDKEIVKVYDYVGERLKCLKDLKV